MLMTRLSLTLSLLLCLIAPLFPAAAQPSDTVDLTLESLFASSTFYGDAFRGGRWAEAGPLVRYIERDDESEATDLVEYNLETDTRTVLIDGDDLAKPD